MSKKRYTIVASAYNRRGRLLYSCTNSYKDSSSLMRYYARKVGQPYRVYNHSEIRCLEVAMFKMKKQVDKLVVMRYDADGNLKDAKPCKICQYAINDLKVRTTIYSTEEGMKEL